MAAKETAKRVSNSDEDIQRIREAMYNTEDLVVHYVFFGEKNVSTKENVIAILYVGSISEPGDVFEKLAELKLKKLEPNIPIVDMHFAMELAELGSTVRIRTLEEIVQSLLEGSTVLLLPEDDAISVSSLSIKFRQTSEPDSEVSIKGPHDGFNEYISNNISLVRFHLHSPRLKVEYIQRGFIAKQKMAIMSMGGITNQQLLSDVRNRIKNIPIDAILDAHYVEEWITGNRRTIFPLIESTERPDRVAAALLEGRIAIFVNGSPFVLIAPYVFMQTFQASEDYYWKPQLSTLLRLIRLFSGFMTLFLPAFYVATSSFHQEFLPTPFLMTISQASEPLPYPVVIEVVVMELVFEILREAGVRLPRQVGQAVSIVGALVLGEAAVQAGLVGPVTVILVSFTGICTLTLPVQSGAFALRMLRFVIILVAGILGYVGIVVVGVLIFIHLCSLRSFGSPYLAPLAPTNWYELTDIFIRRPLKYTKKRPELFRSGYLNRIRQRR